MIEGGGERHIACDKHHVCIYGLAYDSKKESRGAMQATDLYPPEVIEADGKLRRLGTNGRAWDTTRHIETATRDDRWYLGDALKGAETAHEQLGALGAPLAEWVILAPDDPCEQFEARMALMTPTKANV